MIERSCFERLWSIYSREPCGPFSWTPFVVPQTILAHIKAFMAEYEANYPGAEEVLSAVGIYIAHSLVRALLDIRVPVSRGGERLEILRAIEIMHTRYGEKIPVSRLARLVHRSESHFGRLFKQDTGCSPGADAAARRATEEPAHGSRRFIDPPWRDRVSRGETVGSTSNVSRFLRILQWRSIIQVAKPCADFHWKCLSNALWSLP